MESLTPYLRQLIAQSAALLKSIETEFAVDTSGFSTSTYVRWFDVKYGNNEDWHDWVEMHLMFGHEESTGNDRPRRNALYPVQVE